jgi:probable blue pigment (indigoidine) exporter
VALGWAVLGEDLTPLQLAGFVIVLASVWLSQRN